jgi:hypothetical protein
MLGAILLRNLTSYYRYVAHSTTILPCLGIIAAFWKQHLHHFKLVGSIRKQIPDARCAQLAWLFAPVGAAFENEQKQRWFILSAHVSDPQRSVLAPLHTSMDLPLKLSSQFSP